MADALLDGLQENWERRQPGDYFHGTAVCLSSLLAAGRYQELLELLDKAPFIWWRDRRWGVQALAAMGKQAEAIAYAEASRGPNDEPGAIARVCEENAHIELSVLAKRRRMPLSQPVKSALNRWLETHSHALWITD